MNILLVTMEMNIGGAETHVLELSKELKRKGNNVIVISAGGKLVELLEKYGIMHIYAPLKDKKIKHVIQSYKTIVKTIQDEKIDVVHAHARIPGFISGIACKKTNTHFVTTIHGIYRVNFLLKIITNWGEKTLAVSEDIRKHAIKEYKLIPENVFITVNGIDIESYKKIENVNNEFGLDKSKRTIMHVSRIDENSSEVAKALIDISDELNSQFESGVQIVIVGGGNYLDKLKEYSNGKKNVIFTGGPRTDVDKLLNNADIFVGVSRAALEAMACELPVILVGNSSYGQGYQGIFTADMLEECKKNNFTARNCAALSNEKLKEDILSLLKADNLQEYGKYNRKIVIDNYSVSKMADDAIKIYDFNIKAGHNL